MLATNPLLPLELWRRVFGYNPFFFWQLANTTRARTTSKCDPLIHEYAWQDTNRVGRREVRQAIDTACNRLGEWLGYDIAPRYITETVRMPTPQQSGYGYMGYADDNASWRSIQVSHGYVQAVGTETFVFLGEQPLVFADLDGDGLSDHFTLSIDIDKSITGDEIAVLIPASNYYSDWYNYERPRVEPLRIDIIAGPADSLTNTLVVTGYTWQIVRPILYEGLWQGSTNQKAIDPSDITNYCSTLEVWRRYPASNGNTVDTAQCTLIWETYPCPDWAFCTNTSSSDPAVVGKAVGRCGIRDSRLGILTPVQEVYDATSNTWSAANCYSWCRMPDRVEVRYLAGYPLEQNTLAKRWIDIAARLSAAELAKPICACDEANHELYRWQEDHTEHTQHHSRTVSNSALINPFGPRAGHIYAWNQISHVRDYGAISVG